MAASARERPTQVLRALWPVVGIALAGAVVGLVVAVFTPAKLEIAGSPTSVWLRFGQSYDQFGIAGVLSAKRATGRSVLGEAIGVRADLHLDASVLTDSSGALNTDILPAYVQAYSDPDQIADAMRHALLLHFVVIASVAAAVAVVGYGAWRGYRHWRRAYDRRYWPDRGAAARAYRAPERTFARRAAVVLVVIATLNAIPSGRSDRTTPQPLTGDAIFAGTPLAGIKVSGLLRPAFVAAESYIETYFDQTNKYYNQLRDTLTSYLQIHPVELPAPPEHNVVHLGFVTDRHCNIGMDRVIVALLDHFHIRTLISGGDDAFSGSFGFEAACTRNLAEESAAAGVADVFVGGNHDSPTTIADEGDQGITTLTGSVVQKNGLRFIGLPDPRTSRYSQGIVPASTAAQDRLLRRQGAAAGRAACLEASGPLIAVLHDPLAGLTALRAGCAHVTLALDGHTHKQGTPIAVDEPDDSIGYQFTGGSAGGAPTESAVEHDFAARLTVGPLNHDAWVNIVSLDQDTGQLIAVTAFHFTPDQTITVTQDRIG